MNSYKLLIVTGILILFTAGVIAQIIEISSPNEVIVGEEFTVNVTLNVSNSSGARFDLLFDNTILTALSLDGDLINTTCTSGNPIFSPAHQINNTAGKIIFEEICLGGTFSGSGNLAAITFKSISTGASELSLENIMMTYNCTPNCIYDSGSNYTGDKTVTACDCITDDTRLCTAANGCTGSQTCTAGVWGDCITTHNNCDTNCDGTPDTCQAEACTPCSCITGDTRLCTATNNCDGSQTCAAGVWGDCITTHNNCDTNCDGTPDTCQAEACTPCDCITGDTRSCTAANGCSGTQICAAGTWGICTTTLNNCDTNCDGTPDTCQAEACTPCDCITGDTRSCTAANNCDGSQTCTAGVWGDCNCYHKCDLNYDGIYIHDYNDLMHAYKCFLGINKDCRISSRNWNDMQREYNCFNGIVQ